MILRICFHWGRGQQSPPLHPSLGVMFTTILCLLLSTGVQATPLRDSRAIITRGEDDVPVSIDLNIGNNTELLKNSLYTWSQLEAEGEKKVIQREEAPIVVQSGRTHGRKKGGKQGVRKKEKLEGRRKALTAVLKPGNPKMQSTCEGQQFKQRIRHPNCLTKVLVNKFCLGTCTSFYIPGKKLKHAFKTCSACAPLHFNKIDVTLDCPGQDPPTYTQSILKIETCECKNVDISSSYQY